MGGQQGLAPATQIQPAQRRRPTSARATPGCTSRQRRPTSTRATTSDPLESTKVCACHANHSGTAAAAPYIRICGERQVLRLPRKSAAAARWRQTTASDPAPSAAPATQIQPAQRRRPTSARATPGCTSQQRRPTSTRATTSDPLESTKVCACHTNHAAAAAPYIRICGEHQVLRLPRKSAAAARWRPTTARATRGRTSDFLGPATQITAAQRR